MICNTLTEAVIKLSKDIKKNFHTKKEKTAQMERHNHVHE